MIAVIYRFRLKLGREEEYKRHWQNVANYFRQNRGAIGSSLHHGDDGLWYVYSVWPNDAIRENAWPLEGDLEHVDEPTAVYIEHELAHMKACVEEKWPDLKLDIVDNRLFDHIQKSAAVPQNSVVHQNAELCGELV